MQGQQFRTELADQPRETHSMRETELFCATKLDHSRSDSLIDCRPSGVNQRIAGANG
jgi:hypothetical protein